MEETIYWAHLAAIEGLGGATFDELLKRFGSLKRALEAPLHEVREIPSMDERTAEAICRAHMTLDATRAQIEELMNRGIRVITKLDSLYPPRLREAPDPPPLIYLAGDLLRPDDRAVAIIGSRDCSEISARRSRQYARYLAQEGLTVVSGYAPGVDLSAHLGALEAGGRTIIIPGCGADYFDFSPLSTLDITSFSDLAKQAVWISEQPPGADWSGKSATARNRLVAAQARAVLVMEARLQSSTLDTVARAKKLDRPIFVQTFATISEKVLGNEMLRKEGAGLVQSVEDLQPIVDLVLGEGRAGGKKSPPAGGDDLRR